MATQETTAPSQQQVAVQNQPAKKPIDIFKDRLNAKSVMEQFNNALNRNASTFIASLIELYTSDSKLQLCDPNQVIKEALKAASLNLPINKALGQAYIIPFYNTKKDLQGRKQKVYEPTFQIGYKGLYQLAMRTNQYRIINADVVYEGELRKVSRLTGEIDLDGERVSDKVVGYFAYFELLNGYSKALYMSVEQMAQHAKHYSQSIKNNREVTVESLLGLSTLPVVADGGNTVGWLGNFHGMAIKTALRNLLSKYGYLSVSLQRALEADADGETTSNDIAQNANKESANANEQPQVVDLTTVEYEEVSDTAPEVANEPEIDPGF